MKNYWKYIFFVVGISLVLLSGTGVSANATEIADISGHAISMQNPDNSSGYLNIHNDLCEDEQIQQSNIASFTVEFANFIPNPQLTNPVFQPCIIPWEPPK